MRNIILFALMLFACLVSGQSDTGYPKPSYIRWLPETGTYYLLVGDTTTHAGAWFELGSGFSITGGVISVASTVEDSVFVMGDSLCAISLGDTICVANDSVYITQDSFCYIVDGDTTCVDFTGGLQGINIYNTSDTITAGEDRIVIIPSTSTLAFKESGSVDFIKMYPLGDSTVFSKDAQFNAGILDGDGDIGGAGQVMTTTGSQTNWVNPAALNVPISGLFAALGTNSINNSNYQQEWTWPAFTGANDGLKLTAAGTAHTTSTGNLLSAEMSGANAASSVTSATASIRNIHSGTGAVNYGLQAEALNGASNYAIYGSVAGGYGIYGNASTGTAIYGIATTGTPLAARLNHTTTNDIKAVANLERISSGTAGNGIGASLTFASEVSTGSSDISNTIASEWTEVTYATRGSKLSLSGVTSGTTQNILEILGSGATRLNKYGIGTFTGTPAYTLQVDASGNLIEGTTSGSTKINSLTAADGNNTINNAAYAQEWQWNTLAAGSGLKLSSTSTAAAGNTQKLFEVSLSGANATASQSTYAGYLSNTHSGATSQNYGLYATATGATANYGVYGHTTSGASYGVYGLASSGSGFGVYGEGGFRGVAGVTSTGVAVFGSATTSGTGGNFSSSSGFGINVSSTSGTGAAISSTSGLPLSITTNPSSTNTVVELAQFTRSTSGTAANDIGGSVSFVTETATSSGTSNAIASKWTDATHATRTSTMTITGVNSASTVNLLTMSAAGRSEFNTTVKFKAYTVATLPTGTVGDMAYVTDASAPTYLATVSGGGAVVCPVFYNGTNWVAH